MDRVDEIEVRVSHRRIASVIPETSLENARRSLHSLSPREHEVLEHLCAGHSSAAIAKGLGVSAGTLWVIRHRIAKKFNICGIPFAFAVLKLTLMARGVSPDKFHADAEELRAVRYKTGRRIQ